MPASGGCGFNLTLHNDLNRRGCSTSMWSFQDIFDDRFEAGTLK
jgi:hypothetical protein